MDHFFKIIRGFMETDVLVIAHGVSRVEEALEQEMDLFVQGKLPETLRPNFCRRVLQNQESIQLLADKMKAAREPVGP
jgi:hypothetical protein